MKKLLTAKYLSLFMLLSLLSGKAEARHYDDVYYENRDCCPSSCYECGCNPLYCGAWDLQIHGGVAPIVWRKRDAILGVSCASVFTSPILPLFDEVPKFKDFFKTPWYVGGQVGYHWSDNTRLYLEFNYSQARRKSDPDFTTLPIPPVTTVGVPVRLEFSKYKVFDAYVGARYYWDRWCDRVAFFLGGKVGLVHHKGVDSRLVAGIANGVPVFEANDIGIFRRNTNVSGGVNFGLDVCFCGNWSFVLTGEVVASCGPRAVQVIPLAATVVIPPFTAGGLRAFLPGHIETELRFPVTAGIRYSF